MNHLILNQKLSQTPTIDVSILRVPGVLLVNLGMKWKILLRVFISEDNFFNVPFLVEKQLSEVFYKINVFKNFAKFTGKQLCWSLFLIKLKAWRPASLLKRWFQRRCFPMSFAKFLMSVLKNICERRLLLVFIFSTSQDYFIAWTSNYFTATINTHLFQLTYTCSKSTVETLEKGVKYVQS